MNNSLQNAPYLHADQPDGNGPLNVTPEREALIERLAAESLRYVDDPEGKVTLTELHPHRNRRVRVEMVTPGERPGNRGWWS